MTQRTFAVIQTSLTSFDFGSPAPVIVTGLPGTATSGTVFSADAVSDARPASASGPKSGAAPGITGGVTGVGVAVATDWSASASTRAPLAATTLLSDVERVGLMATLLPCQRFAALLVSLAFGFVAALRAGTIVNW